MADTRRSSKKMYTACKTCPDRFPGLSTCRKGHDTWFKRTSKDNHCPMAMEVHRAELLSKDLHEPKKTKRSQKS